MFKKLSLLIMIFSGCESSVVEYTLYNCDGNKVANFESLKELKQMCLSYTDRTDTYPVYCTGYNCKCNNKRRPYKLNRFGDEVDSCGPCISGLMEDREYIDTINPGKRLHVTRKCGVFLDEVDKAYYLKEHIKLPQEECISTN